jgi:hypothetical protein
VIHRKTNVNRKTHSSYYHTLRGIFGECYRILKPNGPLVFTFNNKDIRTLFCVLKSAIDAGFALDPEGIVYQEPIGIYKNTAHQRFAGTLHGDFIYTFKKAETLPRLGNKRKHGTLAEDIANECRHVVNENRTAEPADLFLKVIARILPVIVEACHTADECEDQLKALGVADIDSLIGRFSAS